MALAQWMSRVVEKVSNHPRLTERSVGATMVLTSLSLYNPYCKFSLMYGGLSESIHFTPKGQNLKGSSRSTTVWFVRWLQLKKL